MLFKTFLLSRKTMDLLENRPNNQKIYLSLRGSPFYTKEDRIGRFLYKSRAKP